LEQPIRIVLADDHAVVRYGLRHLLESQGDLRVLGEAATAREAVDLVREVQPDVVVLDLEMDDARGVEALRRLREHSPGTAVIVHTAYDGDQRILEAVELGIQGYVLKGSDMDYLPRAIRTVHAGGSFIEPAVAAKLVRHMGGQAGRQGDREVSLTDRERQVIALLAKGGSNRDIAAKLFISERTAKFHVSALLRKLGARNRTQALLIAAQRGFVDLI
jgi:DNA-binding NarL/FixJ family response regulator